MHPAHVPLEIEPQAACVNGMTNHRPSGRLLRNHHDPRTRAMSYLIQLLQQRNRFEILASTKLIRLPLPFLAAVVEIQHRRHRIDTQSIHMKLVEPIERISDEEIAHLITPVVEDVRAPIRMFAFAWIEMLIKRGAIEATERKSIFRKVRGNPIHDHADAALVQVVDEVTKIIRLAVTGRGRVIVRDLITPRWSIWMFLERQKLHVGEAQFRDVVGKRLGHLTISERTILVFHLAAPRTEVNFVNREWLAEVFASGASLHPLCITKLVPRRVDNRRSVRR